MPDPASALARWRQSDEALVETPTIVRSLAGGLTNQSFLVDAAGQRYVLRLNSTRDRELGIDRKCEQRILADAAAAGIAPPVRFHCVEHGILVTEFLDGVPFALQTRADRDALLDLVRRIHALPTVLPVQDYYAHAARYRTLLDRAGVALPVALAELGDTVAAGYAAGRYEPDVLAICHRDLNPGNVLRHAGALYAIDWEYAACGRRAFDYAALAVEWRIAPADLSRASGIALPVLEHAVQLYDYTVALWYLVREHTTAL